MSIPSKICIFSRCLKFLDYSYLAEIIAELGFDGADLTVRKGRHVFPENVREDLPKATKGLEKVGKGILMIVNNINTANDSLTAQIF